MNLIIIYIPINNIPLLMIFRNIINYSCQIYSDMIFRYHNYFYRYSKNISLTSGIILLKFKWITKNRRLIMSIDIHLKEGENLKSLNDLLNEQFGFKGVYLFEQFCNLAAVSDYCDICTHEDVYINAIISKTFLVGINQIDGLDLENFHDATSNIPIIYDGDKEINIHFKNVVAVYPMPGGDPHIDDLNSVDLEDGEEVVGNNHKTIREIIQDHYKCKNDEETDKYLRRYLAST